MEKIRIVSAPDNSKPFVVIYKPSGLASAPLSAQDKDNALFQVIELFPEIKNVHGKKEIEAGLLHRIDTATSGLLLIATEQEFYDKLLEEQNSNNFIKYYRAICAVLKNHGEGFPECGRFLKIKEGEEFGVESYFRYFGKGNKEVRPVLQNASKTILKKIGKLKLYTTNIKILKTTEENVEVMCSITQGFKHQVRCHLAWCGLPIIGDKVYNPYATENEEFLFEACGLEFEYKGKKYNFGI